MVVFVLMTTASVDVDILVVGNCCHDTLVLPSGQLDTLGGSSAYISAVLSSLRDVTYAVVAKVGRDFAYFDRVEFNPLVAETPSTHFVNDMTSGVRVQRLRSSCAPIYSGDIPNKKARVGLVCGVANEIHPETVRRVRELSSIMVGDAQGLLRTTDSDGVVSLRPLSQTPFCAGLDLFDFIKASRDEVSYFDVPLPAKTCLLITDGPNGCTLVEGGHENHIPVAVVAEVDATGAGDCFIAGFAYGLIRGYSAQRAAQLGNQFGALAVQQVGVPNFSGMSN